MRVLQVNSVCGYGSTGNIVVDLYYALKSRGHECCIAYGRGSAPKDVENYRIGSDIDVYIHGLCSRITDRHAFYSTRATERFVQWMKEYDPDVIHLHNLHGYYINIEVLFDALKQMDKPVIWTLHDCWAFTGHCAYYTAANCQKWKNGCEHCPQWRSYPSSVMRDGSASNYLRKKDIFCGLQKLMIITPSEWLKKEVEKSFLAKYPVSVIYNGIDLQVFRPQESAFREKHNLRNEKIILGVANVWTERKGLRVFLNLADKLDESYKIVMVGVKQKQQKRNSKILFIERTDSKQELAEIYTMADLYLNPSVEETMGLTTVEALACGTSVLVWEGTALPEIVEYDKIRLIRESSLQQQIEEMVGTKTDRYANRTLAGKYEKEKQYGMYIDLYTKHARIED